MEIIDDIKQRGVLLGSPTPNFTAIGGHLLLTISLPPTKMFLKKTSDQQKQVYRKLWHFVADTFKKRDSGFVFEYTEHGRIHLHGYISLDMTERFIIGVVCDLAKGIIKYIPGKDNQFLEKRYFPQYYRYRSPAVCIQFCTEEDIVQRDKWFSYMNKEQLKGDTFEK